MRVSKRRFFNCRPNPRLSVRLKPNDGQPTSADAVTEEAMEMTMPAVTKIREDEAALKKERMLIGGKWVDSVSGEWLEVEDPAHRRPIAPRCRGAAPKMSRAP